MMGIWWGWGGMITSMHACGTMWCYVDGMFLHVGGSTWSPHMESIWLGWGGVGWDDNVHARLRNYVMLRWWNVLARWQLYVVTAHGKYMIGVGWGEGWGGMITSMHAGGTMWCYVDGMFLHVGSSTWSPHMESIWLGWGGVGWDDNVHWRNSWQWPLDKIKTWNYCLHRWMSKLEDGRQRKPQAKLGGEVSGPHA